jgi:transposase
MRMSVHPRAWPEPAPEVAAAIRATYRRRQPPLPVTIRDRLGELFPDAEFAAAFGARGRPGWSPGRLALITVLQMAENLTDRQAAEAVRDKRSWKYALGLGLDDEGFDASVLAEFRARVVASGLEQRALDLLLGALVTQGLLIPGAGADRLHACGRGGAGSQPAGAGRRERAGGRRGPRRGGAGLAGRGDRRRGMGGKSQQIGKSRHGDLAIG